MPLAAIFAAGGPPRPKPKPGKGAKRAKRAAPLQAPAGPARVSQAILKDGRAAIEVQLKGTLAAGAVVLMDDCTWPRVMALHGDQWGLRESKGHRYVVSRGGNAGIVLARVLAWAQPDQAVTYRNGNPLDCRRSNLEVIGAAEAVERALGGSRRRR